MQRKHVYIVAATAAVMGIAIIARLQWRPARSDEPTSPERHDRGAAAADVRRAGPAAARGPACVTQRDPVRPRGPRGALDLMSGAARVQALAVSTEFPNPTLRLVSDRVT
ncbi:MAG: hypothetical protein IT379_06105, partial [Deltaproteobacteria bacterium]|nr:hypothetical protein [Deltaproteobacteria bacterium]